MHSSFYSLEYQRTRVRSAFKSAIGRMVIFVLATAMLGGCGNSSGAEHHAMNERIHIQLGQSGDDILENYPGLFSMSDHPSGAKFHAARWTKDARGTVEIGPSETLFVIHHALSATGNYSPSFANENIIEWNINAGLAESSPIMHDAARKQFQSIRANLRKGSRHRYIDPDAPRLSGENVLRYAESTPSVYGLDTDYEPTLDEWMHLPGRTLWKLWSKEGYLTIALSRDLSLNDVNQPGAYFIEFNLRSEKEQFHQLVGADKRTVWQQALRAEIKLLKEKRQQAESTLRKQGVNIDEAYQDPPGF